jgi:hypothetical protein
MEGPVKKLITEPGGDRDQDPDAAQPHRDQDPDGAQPADGFKEASGGESFSAPPQSETEQVRAELSARRGRQTIP